MPVDAVPWVRSRLERWIPYGLYAGLAVALEGCEDVLDLGCGTDSMIRHFVVSRRVIGVDRYYPSLLNNRKTTGYAAWVQADLCALPFGPKSVDAVTALDVLEHLEKAEGLARLKEWEAIARKRVVILTPNGFVPQAASENPWQAHRSGWTVEEFERQGYRVSGVYGWKRLRGPYARLKWKPAWFWEIVSALSQPWVGCRARLAFHLLAVKGVEETAWACGLGV